MDSGSLLIFSPTALTQDVKSTIDSLGGNLKYIVAPDIEHHIFLTPWKQAYPNAEIIAPEGLREKREQNPNTKGLEFNHILTSSNKNNFKVSDEFSQEFEIEYIDGHPSNEIVLLHKRTRTMIQADLIFNLPATEQYSKSEEGATQGILTKIFAAAASTGAPATWHKRFIWYILSSKDRKRFSDSIAVIDQWNFDRMIPCHGDVIETGAKDVYRRVCEWLLEENKKYT